LFRALGSVVGEHTSPTLTAMNDELKRRDPDAGRDLFDDYDEFAKVLRTAIVLRVTVKSVDKWNFGE
jgi:hypothetical protein